MGSFDWQEIWRWSRFRRPAEAQRAGQNLSGRLRSGGLQMSDFLSITSTLRRRLSMCLAGFALSVAVATPARADMFTPSKAAQIKLGDQAAAEVMRKYRV